MAPFRNAGHSDLEIAKSLNAEGLTMINGEAWDSSGVARIIALDRALAKFRPARGAPSGTHAEQSTKIAAAVAIEGVGKA